MPNTFTQNLSILDQFISSTETNFLLHWIKITRSTQFETVKAMIDFENLIIFCI